MKRIARGIWDAKLFIGLYLAACSIFLGYIFGGAFFWPGATSPFEKSVFLATLCWTAAAFGLAFLIWRAIVIRRQPEEGEDEVEKLITVAEKLEALTARLQKLVKATNSKKEAK